MLSLTVILWLSFCVLVFFALKIRFRGYFRQVWHNLLKDSVVYEMAKIARPAHTQSRMEQAKSGGRDLQPYRNGWKCSSPSISYQRTFASCAPSIHVCNRCLHSHPHPRNIRIIFHISIRIRTTHQQHVTDKFYPLQSHDQSADRLQSRELAKLKKIKQCIFTYLY